MKTIEELKKEAISKINSCIDCYADEPDGYINTFIYEAVLTADLQNAEKIAEFERPHEKEIKEAVERERERIAVIIRNIIQEMSNVNAFVSPFSKTFDALSELEISLSTPQPENVPDTMLASEDVLKKDWDSPAEDEAWKDLTDENVCEWVKVKDGLYQTGCQLEEDLWFYDDKMTYCPSCAKPIKTICTPQQEYCEWVRLKNSHNEEYYGCSCLSTATGDIPEKCPSCGKPNKVKEV